MPRLYDTVDGIDTLVEVQAQARALGILLRDVNEMLNEIKATQRALAAAT